MNLRSKLRKSLTESERVEKQNGKYYDHLMAKFNVMCLKTPDLTVDQLIERNGIHYQAFQSRRIRKARIVVPLKMETLKEIIDVLDEKLIFGKTDYVKNKLAEFRDKPFMERINRENEEIEKKRKDERDAF